MADDLIAQLQGCSPDDGKSSDMQFNEIRLNCILCLYFKIS